MTCTSTDHDDVDCRTAGLKPEQWCGGCKAERPVEVRLVQSRRFPNVWSLVDDNGDEYSRTWTDPMFANGAMAAENAVGHAREHGLRIVAVDSVDGPITDSRSGRTVDPASEVIAGIEYRSKRPVVDAEDR